MEKLQYNCSFFYIPLYLIKYLSTIMERYDIIGALRHYATNEEDERNWHFAAGQNWVLNYHASQKDFEPGQIMLACMFTVLPTSVNGVVQSISYDGIIFLGRKFDEDGQACNLDETFEQKYDRRLKDLIEMLINTVNDFSCINKLNATFKSIPYELDKFDTDIDFVAANVTFKEK